MEHAIYAKNFTKSYGSFLALKGIDMEVRTGEIFGFLGPNGAGKTTAIRCMLDMIRRDEGDLKILGHDPEIKPVVVRSLCGYLPGELRLDENTTVGSTLNYLRRLRNGGSNCKEKILDLAKCIAPRAEFTEIGIRPGEKMHEQLISIDESRYTYEFKDYYKILSPLNNWNNSKKRMGKGELVVDGFSYASDTNNTWLEGDKLNSWLARLDKC